jgi:HEAT repeat protein
MHRFFAVFAVALGLAVGVAPAATQQRPPRPPPAPRPVEPPTFAWPSIPGVSQEVWMDVDWSAMDMALDGADWDLAALAFDVSDWQSGFHDWDVSAWQVDHAHDDFVGHLPDVTDLAWPGGTEYRETGHAQTGPPAAWAPNDQADSLYRSARAALNRGDYRRAVELFQQIPTRYPQSSYAPQALYWEAFARYRIGATAELEAALRALALQRERYPEAAAEAQADAAALATRIRGALAARGDREAAAWLQSRAAEGGLSCDREEMAVRAQAMNALLTMDPASGQDLLRRVLARRDECSAPLRKSAVLLVGRRADSSGVDLLIEIARNDPDSEVRSDAIQWLARAPGERPLAVLEETVRSATDPTAQRAAARALVAHPSPRARTVVRALVERSDVGERLRADVLGSFTAERMTPDDAVWLRGLYARLEPAALRQRVITAVSRAGGTENDRWLLDLTQRDSEPLDLRAAALSAAGRKDGVAIAELVGLYDGLAARRLRSQLITVFGRREEPEATDKLIEIVRTGTDPQLRRSAISALTRKNDPRTTRLLMELVDR